MTMRGFVLMSLSLGVLVVAASAEPNRGLGSEAKSTFLSPNQQSGWWGNPGTAHSASSCDAACCAPAAVSRGLGTERKDSTIPAGQQSGWWFSTDTPAASTACQLAKGSDAADKASPVAEKVKDSDGDGVVDERDNCEGTARGVRVDANGCPQEAKAVPQSNWTLQGVQFETGSDKLKRGSLAALDEAADILKIHTRVTVEIQGHTDNVGGTAANQALSEKRAQSVKAYLVDKGIKGGRLEAKGYGETEPSADNATPAGRAQNRRIAFKILSR